MTSFLSVFSVPVAFVLDLIFGDPHRFPHPVRGIGWAITRLESPIRRLIANEKLAGALLTVVVVISTYGITWMLLENLRLLHEAVAELVGIFLIYTCLSVRSLAVESGRVLKCFQASDLPGARRQLATIVGRDSENLDESEIVRATVETIAENTVDGIVSPLFYAVLGGAPLALAYKAVNTLDSMIGYRDARYLNFGKFAARLDDVANFIPARLALPVMSLTALFIGLDFKRSAAIALRDGRKHPSPNAGISEAAFAGALSVQLGGLNFYRGVPSPKPCLGDAEFDLKPDHIRKARKLMVATSVLSLMILVGGSWLFTEIIWQNH